jgi:undecaprenol kinase/diacylglycerol kinase (ATP)
MRKFILGFKYAFNGIKYAVLTQLNFKFHMIAALLIVGAGIYYNLKATEWLWISVAIALVMAAELFNTALEVLVDLVSPNVHPKAGIVKDLASGAVLLIAILAAIIGVSIFLPYIL